MRIAVVDREKCHPSKCGRECVKFCPVNRMAKECVTVDEQRGCAAIAEELCTGCGICTKKCPFGAITIINLPQEMGAPLHQYGPNAFRIYGVPCPRSGVVGLVGPNGIGKSTIIKILSGNLVPNLGSGEGEWKKVLARFRGQEIQKYLAGVADAKTRLAYKPQEVGRIPGLFGGKIGDLLEKTDERGALRDVVARLDISGCLGKTLDKVSGGELQRVAIAATMLKKADFYFFDEPSSYLDIKQRLHMASAVRDLAASAPVFVVEHDLAVLDYLTDYVYILYGRPGAYGVLSTLKASRTGINEFLDGFLKAENTRIRDYPIRFEVRPPASEWRGKKTYSYGAFEKRYKAFSLKAEAGELKKGEAVAVLGPNAIGKSTFMKVLAGVEKPTRGDPGFAVKVSYKPQYINIEKPGTVLELIDREKGLDRALFDAELRKIVEDLLLREAAKLSGGEAQRLAIALALAKECEVCLLDEPSAFLDIEQRLGLATVIKRITEKKEMTTLVVDHDVVFEDAIANRIMLFEGEPEKKGRTTAPMPMRDGMNRFLKEMAVTFRRDPDSGRPRVNKPGSQMDEEQRRSGEYYYTLGG
jgi:ATP-binding cassette subfamily E protein 1